LKFTKEDVVPLIIKKTIIFCAVFLALWTICITRVAPTFNADDSPETTTAFYTLGIQHPPGYPLNTLIGKIFTLVPAGNIMYRSNMVALFFHLIAVILLYIFVAKNFKINKTEETGNKIFACMCSIMYLFCCTPFMQSLSAKGSVYTLSAFLTIIFFIGLFNIKNGSKYFYFASYIYGISMCNHWQSTIIFFPAVLYYLIVNEKYLNRRIAGRGMLIFFAGTSMYMYAVIRSYSNPVYAFGDIKSLKDLVWLVGRQYYTLLPNPNIMDSIISNALFYMKDISTNQYVFYTALFFIPGVYLLVKKFKIEGIIMVLSYLMIVSGILFVSAPLARDKVQFIMKPISTSAYMFSSIFISAGIFYLINLIEIKKVVKITLYLTTIVFLLITVSMNLPDYSRYFISYNYVKNLMQTMQTKSIFIGDTDINIFGTQYARFVEKKDFFPIRTNLLFYDWYRRQLSADYKNEITIPPRASNGALDMYNIMDQNKGSPIYCGENYSADLGTLSFQQCGIIYRVVANIKRVPEPDPAYFDLYYFTGIIGNKIKYDDFTREYVVECYGKNYVKLAQNFEKNVDFARALLLYERAFIFYKNDILALKLGKYYLQRNGIIAAEDYFKKAIAINQNNIQAYSGLVSCNIYNNDFVNAKLNLLKILKYDKSNTTAKDLLMKIGGN
jgi:tetratricopeptide (TPR) repeat protein